jgi:hypothetical protein
MIEAMKHYEAALLEAFPRGATGDVFEHWNKARQAIEQAEKQEPVGKFAKFTDGIWREVTDGSAGIPLYTTPQPQRERVVFPTMLRKMWSGGEVQAWLDENVNKEKNT